MRVAVLDDYQAIARRSADWPALAGAQVDVFHDHLVAEDDLVRRLRDHEVIVIMRERTPFQRCLIERLPNLRLLVTTGRRNASVDLAACADRGIVVSGTEGGPAGAAAELAFGLILDVMRRITLENRALLDGNWQTGVGRSLEGRTLGLLGLGRLGSRVARMARAFDMNVIAWSQNLTPERAVEAGALYVDRDELFAQADIVSLHLILSDRSQGIVGTRELSLMKKDAIIINTSRAQLIQQDALIEALANGAIAGAGLDVFEQEPLPLDHPLRTLSNTVLTPHIGYVTQETYRAYFEQAVEAIAAWRAGTPIRLLS